MTGIAKGAQWCGYARQEKEVGVTWELVGVAVKWNTTGEWRALERVRERKEGDMGRSGQIGGGGKRGVLM
jgi:hypothetical protein